MDALTHEQIEELQDYQAIKHGGWKLLAGIIAALCALSPIIGSLAILFRIVPASLDDWLVKVVLVLGAFEGILLFGVLVPDASRDLRNVWPFVWLKNYWRCNVRGYVVAHYTEGGQAKCSDPFPRGYDLQTNVFLNAYPFVVIWPLGGWFHRPEAYWRAKPSGWMVEHSVKRFPGTPVRVTDKNGSSLRFATIEDAMSFIAQPLERAAMEPLWRDSSDMPFSWLRVLEDLSKDRDDARRDRELDLRTHAQSIDALFQVLYAATGQALPSVKESLTDWLVEQVRRLIAERDAARGEVDRYKDGFLPAAVKDRDVACKERDEAVKFVGGIADELGQTDRLAQTIDGLRILERIHGWLDPAFERMGDGHAQGQAKLQLALVREKLTEKQKRDRRRHGKGAGAAAT